MARYQHVDTSPRLLPVDLASRLLPGAFEQIVRRRADPLELACRTRDCPGTPRWIQRGGYTAGRASDWVPGAERRRCGAKCPRTNAMRSSARASVPMIPRVTTDASKP